MNTVNNDSKNRLLKLIFKDNDVIHLLPGETLLFPDYFIIVRKEFI